MVLSGRFFPTHEAREDLQRAYPLRHSGLLCEHQMRLLVSGGVLLSPQETQERWPVILDELCPCDLCMASGAKRQHESRAVVAGQPVMHCNRALPPLHGRATRHNAAILVASQHCFSVAAEVCRVLHVQYFWAPEVNNAGPGRRAGNKVPPYRSVGLPARMHRMCSFHRRRKPHVEEALDSQAGFVNTSAYTIAAATT